MVVTSIKKMYYWHVCTIRESPIAAHSDEVICFLIVTKRLVAVIYLSANWLQKRHFTSSVWSLSETDRAWGCRFCNRRAINCLNEAWTTRLRLTRGQPIETDEYSLDIKCLTHTTELVYLKWQATALLREEANPHFCLSKGWDEICRPISGLSDRIFLCVWSMKVLNWSPWEQISGCVPNDILYTVNLYYAMHSSN